MRDWFGFPASDTERKCVDCLYSQLPDYQRTDVCNLKCGKVKELTADDLIIFDLQACLFRYLGGCREELIRPYQAGMGFMLLGMLTRMVETAIISAMNKVYKQNG